MAEARFLARARLQSLLEALRDAGYECIGPRVRDGAIVYEPIESADELPHGVHDRQAPGEYRLETDAAARCFAWANGPQALKPLLFAPRESLWTVARDARGRLMFEPAQPVTRPRAVLGVRACDLAALRLQDAHFRDGPHPDPAYGARRDGLFLIAVHCTHPAATCFCASTGDGPRATSGYDLALSELDEGFIVEAGTAAGMVILNQLPTVDVTAPQQETADREIAAGARAQQRALPGTDLQRILFERLNHPRWEEVAQRCLSCANCTAVCPTCFCYSEHEAPSLDGGASEHTREWDSCFTFGHSYIHGGAVRAGTRERYRQWLTHKLGSWHEQYGRSGCVGCGRCIAWCPVGIDITEEAGVICAE
jgi:sulfhydrogenase subunit beta (sulfur reductase)